MLQRNVFFFLVNFFFFCPIVTSPLSIRLRFGLDLSHLDAERDDGDTTTSSSDDDGAHGRKKKDEPKWEDMLDEGASGDEGAGQEEEEGGDEMRAWLRDLGLEEYHGVFVSHGVTTVAQVQALKDADFATMNVKQLHRRKLLGTVVPKQKVIAPPPREESSSSEDSEEMEMFGVLNKKGTTNIENNNNATK